jgi:streptomycin 6-kinase
VEECAERWGLRVGHPFPYGFVSVAFPVRTADGGEAVLKVQRADRESEHEAAALELWGGEGAVRLLEHDPDRGALLLERCRPGTTLGELEPDAALGVVIGLLPRLWKPAGEPFTPLADEAAAWTDDLPETWERAGQPFERWLLDTALDSLRTLAASQGERALLDQDLHSGNVLRAEREPWLVIDPKPLAGEREFSLAPLVRDEAFGEPRAVLDRACGELGLDRERARGWALGQTVAWSIQDGEVLPSHVEVARALLEAR